MKHKDRPERPDGAFGFSDALTLALIAVMIGVLVAGSGIF